MNHLKLWESYGEEALSREEIDGVKAWLVSKGVASAEDLEDFKFKIPGGGYYTSLFDKWEQGTELGDWIIGIKSVSVTCRIGKRDGMISLWIESIVKWQNRETKKVSFYWTSRDGGKTFELGK